MRILQISRWRSESYKQYQNPAERDIQTLKQRVNIIMDRFGCPDKLWLHCLKYVCFLLNRIYHYTLKGIPLEKLTGLTSDISALLRFHFYEEVYYKLDDSEKGFPSTSTEGKGWMIGIAEGIGHELTYLIWTQDTDTVIARSDVRSVHTGPNKRLDLLSGEDIAPSKNFVRSKSDTTTTLFPDENEEADDTEQKQSLIGTLTDLVGKTFLMDKQDNGHRYRARITQVVEDFENRLENNPQRIKFKVSVNNDQFEELLTYQQVVDYIASDETSEIT